MVADENSNSDKLKRICKYCKKNVSKGMNCAKCESSYHNSCAQRVKNCCDQEILENIVEISDDVVLTLDKSDHKQSDTEEIKLLRQLIVSKDVIISDKQCIIDLLHEKISFLEQKLSSNHHLKTQYPTTSNNQGRQVSQQVHTTKKDPPEKHQISNNPHFNYNKKSPNKLSTQDTKNESSKGVSNIQGEPVIGNKQASLEIMKVQTERICDEYINLADDNMKSPEQPWQTVTYKKDAKHTIIPSSSRTYGRGQPSKLMVVAPTRNWIWIGGLNECTTVDNVKEYTKEKFVDKDVCCFDLKSKFRKKCFKIGSTDLSMDELLDPDNWPDKLFIRPFHHQSS
ncbi:unnamed protein product [Phaedon cochleariae]|uniref:Phorbol-ester/DAG-type domain-containing protein n=1 Tax=Phaedon cochleariae TaxID=80249 RepID=A0A9N9SPU3_PHACE|nr:unnamed protein product [Phaedon cochleariae]